MPAKHNEEPRLWPASPRSIAWFACLASSLGACFFWSSLPTLDASPILRVALFATLGFSMLGLVFLFPETTDRKARLLILISAILLRLALLPAPPSDDVNRYLWEGELVLAGENPYSAPADNPRWENRRDAIWEGMNHRDRPTAYPPGIQWVMAATAAIHPSLFSFKILALLGDLAVLLLLLVLLRENAAPLRWAGFYAFNPAVLIAFAAEGHFDSLMVAAMLAAILAARRGKSSAWLWIAAAIQIKLVCLILVPLFLIPKKKPRMNANEREFKNDQKKETSGIALIRVHSRSFAVKILLFSTILILPGLPFLSALPEWFAGVRQFAGSGSFNAPLFTFLSLTGFDHSVVKILCTTAFGVSATAICIARWRGTDLIHSALIMMGALLVCSPIVHFWYLTWLLPLTALRPSFAWTTVSITMAVYFLAWHTQATEGWWGLRHGTAALIWLPFVLAAIAQNRFALSKWLGRPTTGSARGVSPPDQSLALIIPVLKPDKTLLPLLETLRNELGSTSEILIVSSEESTFSLPEKTITAPRGRGNQIAAGISATTGDCILIVHSDSTPRPGFASDLDTAISTHPKASLLIFGQRFDTQSPGTLLIEALNELRVVFGGVAFGDQTMLIRRSALESAGGFPDQPLMEDVEVSMRLATRGDVIYLGREWKISARKWGKNFTKRVILIIRLVASYQFARLRSREHAAEVSKRMYAEYYPKIPKSG
ncbi:MAG: hypothetical protein IZT59_01730 [Verrucomicrobia bacterium]|nr:hypothetical protein [Verrucomicrobiota bacterium]